MRMNKRITRLFALLSGVLLVLSGCSPLTVHESTAEYIESANVKAGAYRTEEVYRGDFQVTYKADAMFHYTKSENLVWESADDRYLEVLVVQNQDVKKGDVLATFTVESVSEADILERQLAIEEANASMSRIVSQYEEAITKKQESMSSLEGTAYQIASLELQQLQSQYARQMAEAQHQVNMQQEALNELQEKKAASQLVAPFDGRITYVNGDMVKGNKVEPYTTLITIEDLSSQVITFTNTSAFGKVPYQSTVTLVDRRTQEAYTGKVVSCSRVTGEENDNVIVEPDSPIETTEYMTSFEASGTLVYEPNVLLITTEAVREEGNSYYVYVVDENNATTKVYIEIGGMSEGVAWVTEGLAEGQAVLCE